MIVNGRPDVKGKVDPKREFPSRRSRLAVGSPARRGTAEQAAGTGAGEVRAWVRKQKPLLFTDTTFRDAHQSLLATRVRTHDMLEIADAVAHLTPQLFSLEMWGGATFDTVDAVSAGRPVGPARSAPRPHPQYPVSRCCCGPATRWATPTIRTMSCANSSRHRPPHGIDVFRIFDSLNWTDNMKVAMEAVRDHTDSICEAAICYTGDILDPKRTKYSLQYYVKMAKELVSMGTHVLAIKDMAGLCKPYAARRW